MYTITIANSEGGVVAQVKVSDKVSHAYMKQVV